MCTDCHIPTLPRCIRIHTHTVQNTYAFGASHETDNNYNANSAAKTPKPTSKISTMVVMNWLSVTDVMRFPVTVKSTAMQMAHRLMAPRVLWLVFNFVLLLIVVVVVFLDGVGLMLIAGRRFLVVVLVGFSALLLVVGLFVGGAPHESGWKRQSLITMCFACDFGRCFSINVCAVPTQCALCQLRLM